MQNNSLWSDALRRLLANRAAMISAVILTLLILSAIFAPFIATHSYAYQNLSLGATAPSAEHFFRHRYTWKIYLAGFYMVRVFH